MDAYKTLTIHERINLRSNTRRFIRNHFSFCIRISKMSPVFGTHLWKGLSATSQPFLK